MRERIHHNSTRAKSGCSEHNRANPSRCPNRYMPFQALSGVFLFSKPIPQADFNPLRAVFSQGTPQRGTFETPQVGFAPQLA